MLYILYIKWMKLIAPKIKGLLLTLNQVVINQIKMEENSFIVIVQFVE